MADMIFHTQGAVLAYLHGLGLKVGRSKLSDDYRSGALRCQPDKSFLEADVLAYAESLKSPAAREKRDRAARLREELDSQKAFFLRILKAIPDAGALEKALGKWLEPEEDRAHSELRAAVTNALRRLRETATRQSMNHPREHTAEDSATDAALSPEFRALCLGVMADGVIHESDAAVLAHWLEAHPGADESATRELRKRLELIKRQGFFSSRDGKALYKRLKGLLGPALPQWLRDTELPERPRFCAGRPVHGALVLTPELPGIFDTVPEIDWNAAFCFTGIFAFGKRLDCEGEARKLGGFIVGEPIRSAPCYVVVGSVASQDWAHCGYGRKIEIAMQYREAGAPIKNISEDVWAKALLQTP